MFISTFECYLLGVFIIGDLCEIFMRVFIPWPLLLCILSVESSGESSRGECSCESYEFTIDTFN